MARVVPELDELALRDVTSAAERSVYVALRDHLPPDYFVIHSLQLVGTSGNGIHDDMEADFVVFAPERGFLVIEVKGGGIEYDGASRKWFSVNREGRHPIKDPFKQSMRSKHEVLGFIRSSRAWGGATAPRILAGHAVLFPDVEVLRALEGPDRPAQLMGGRPALSDPGAWVKSVFAFWEQNDRSWSPLGERGLRVVESLFCSKVTLKAPLALDIEREHLRQVQLTDRQARVLRMLSVRYRAAIAGGAGTGKTLLALRHAKELAASGKLTLLVCYNQALGDFLKREVQGLEQLHALTFHDLCNWRVSVVRAGHGVDLFEEARHMYPGESSADVQWPFALARSVEFDPFRYDAIVVDEGQDFGDEWWLGLELILKDRDDSHFYVFYDPNQSVYRMAESFPITDAPLLLTENCRNTRPIHDSAYHYYTGFQVDPPDLEGQEIVNISARDIRSQAAEVRKVVSALVSDEKVSPEEIVVLVVADGKAHYYEALRQLPAPTGTRWSFELLWEPGAVLVDTARRFKGLEAAVVVLWGLDRLDDVRDRELKYVSLSRARSRVWAVGGGRPTG